MSGHIVQMLKWNTKEIVSQYKEWEVIIPQNILFLISNFIYIKDNKIKDILLYKNKTLAQLFYSVFNEAFFSFSQRCTSFQILSSALSDLHRIIPI